MPTVGEFMRAAALLEDSSAAARTMMAPVDAAMGPDVLVGGLVTSTTERTINERSTDAAGLSAELVRLASECRYRAAVVAAAAAEAAAYADAYSTYSRRRRSYDQQLDVYRSRPDSGHPGRPPHPPTPPPKPPTWADF